MFVFFIIKFLGNIFVSKISGMGIRLFCGRPGPPFTTPMIIIHSPERESNPQRNAIETLYYINNYIFFQLHVVSRR